MEGVSASTETQGLLRDDINDTIQPRILVTRGQISKDTLHFLICQVPKR